MRTFSLPEKNAAAQILKDNPCAAAVRCSSIRVKKCPVKLEF